MNRKQLLNLAGQSVYTSGAAQRLATRVTSAADVAGAVSHYSALDSSLNARGVWCFYVFVSCMVVLFSAIVTIGLGAVPGYWSPDPEWPTFATVMGVGGTLLAALVGVKSAERRDAVRENLQLLVPVVNSQNCQVAPEYAEGGEPEVRAWRDLVVAERGVLCEFDVQILRDLNYAATAARAAAKVRSNQEAACRMAFSIA